MKKKSKIEKAILLSISYYIISIILSILSFIPFLHKNTGDIFNELVAVNVLLIAPLTSVVTYMLYKKVFANNKKFSEIFSYTKKINMKQIAKVILYAILPLIVSILISFIFKNDDVDNTSTETILHLNPIIAIIGSAILAPITEEFIFRGLLYDCYNKDNKSTAYPIVSGILFGILHVQSFNQSVINLLTPVLIIGFGGYCWARLYQKENNIILNILCHMLYNSIVLTIGLR